MTEDEAKTKWCPHTRVGSSLSGNGSINRDYALGTIDQSFCIGSACMAWRWKERYYLDEKPPKSPKLGFCGLAGKP